MGWLSYYLAASMSLGGENVSDLIKGIRKHEETCDDCRTRLHRPPPVCTAGWDWKAWHEYITGEIPDADSLPLCDFHYREVLAKRGDNEAPIHEDANKCGVCIERGE